MAASPNATDGAAIHTDGENDDENVVNGDVDVDVRIGTISSARFNILSTMVGGGCLSLPLAFQQSGNALIGPLMLLATGVVTEFCFRNLVASAGAGRSDVLFRDRRLLRLAPGHDGASQRRDRPEGTFWFGMVGMVASQFHNVPRRGVGDTILHPP
jgi:hypothetical protein